MKRLRFYNGFGNGSPQNNDNVSVGLWIGYDEGVRHQDDRRANENYGARYENWIREQGSLKSFKSGDICSLS